MPQKAAELRVAELLRSQNARTGSRPQAAVHKALSQQPGRDLMDADDENEARANQSNIVPRDKLSGDLRRNAAVAKNVKTRTQTAMTWQAAFPVR